jgi:hypothetical protein
MSRKDYSGLKATASRLIDKFGQDATLSKQGADTGQPWDPEPGAATTSAIILCDIGYSLVNRNETLVQQGDRRVLISAAGSEPVVGDEVIVESVTYTLVESMPLTPGGTVLMYEAILRK